MGHFRQAKKQKKRITTATKNPKPKKMDSGGYSIEHLNAMVDNTSCGQGSLIPLTSDNQTLSTYITQQRIQSMDQNQGLIDYYRNENDLMQSLESCTLSH